MTPSPERNRGTYWNNAAWLTLPPLIVSFALWSRLPAAFAQEAFSFGIPSVISVPENVLRILVFAVPLLFPMISLRRGRRWGWVLYGTGVVAYTVSYVAQITWPSSPWSTSFVGFVAPAWTTLP